MLELKRLPFSGAYLLSLFGTLWASIVAKSTLYTIIFAGVQVFT